MTIPMKLYWDSYGQPIKFVWQFLWYDVPFADFYLCNSIKSPMELKWNVLCNSKELLYEIPMTINMTIPTQISMKILWKCKYNSCGNSYDNSYAIPMIFLWEYIWDPYDDSNENAYETSCSLFCGCPILMQGLWDWSPN